MLPHSLLLFLLAVLPTHATNNADTFNEQLDLIPLPDGKLSSTFTFATRARLTGERWGDNVECASRLLPRSLSSIIRAHNVAELHLSMAAGRWEHDRWGWPAKNGTAHGAEVWAWLEEVEMSTDKTWSALVNTLGGLFCTSLNRLDATRTTSPSLTFRPEGNVDGSSASLRHGLLPLEKPCTENLTPFLALLPCRSAAGLAQLLKPHRIFDSDWQRLGLRILRVEEGVYEVELDVEIVFDPVRLDRNGGGVGKRDWRFSSLFDRTITKACPAADSSSITVSRLDEAGRAALGGASWSVEGDKAKLEVTKDSLPIDAAQQWLQEAQFEYPADYASPPVTFERMLAGYGQERGVIGVEIANALNHSVEAIYVESWPWWLKAYLHTLHDAIGGLEQGSAVTSIRYRPARDRARPTSLEINLSLPPRSTLQLSLDFDKASLRYTEYAPDANRGFDVPAGILVLPTLDKRLYTSNALVMMPTPDFSMPYNVIILTSTALALFFGSVFNMLIQRRWSSGASSASPKWRDRARPLDQSEPAALVDHEFDHKELQWPFDSGMDISKLKVAELKEELGSRGLSKTGLKADLAARLQEAVDAEKAEEPPEKDVEEEAAPAPAPAQEPSPAKRKRDEEEEMDVDETPVAPEPEPQQAAAAVSPPPNDPVGSTTTAPPTLDEAARATKRTRRESPPVDTPATEVAPPPPPSAVAAPPPPPPSAAPPAAPPPATPVPTEPAVARVVVDRSPSPEPTPAPQVNEAIAWLLPAEATKDSLQLRDLPLLLAGKEASVEATKAALSQLQETRWSPESTVTLKGFLSHDIWDATWIYVAYGSLDAPRSDLNAVASALADEEVYGDVVITRFVPMSSFIVPRKPIDRSALSSSIKHWLADDGLKRDSLFASRMDNLRMLALQPGDARSRKADKVEADLRQVFVGSQ